ncbi:hypothetical protein [Bacillus badius]|uniref:Biotin carboxyl carrier protein n=1 Tax=Bacillus badius TaxID=1455 RepID=A0ABR5ATP7_BACBA|nr:hypothetical protein [Bacillus badius]KIL72857.1 Biotin carboxyl carrier protein [Bacillus badius]KIL78125.1 Biotin carboxyl carrier protein [Bacillus badius]KZN98524.1 hypothetical protein A4244_09435 [Bacillus badius]KZR57074.1 hypothetical protein A3781_05250 [Bacillus badius]MED0666183.1 hypothetical protein [Bacillus badius]
MFEELITSPYNGVVQQVLVQESIRIYEWEPLFLIRDEHGELLPVKVGVSGEIQSLEVQEGDKVIPGMVLAYVKEELVVSACD